MSKAYDRVEWGYLRALLLALGFDINWTRLIMRCVSTVTYSVLINDQAHGMIMPQRGLRQRDPLSPLLFVLCTEGLTHLLTKAAQERRITGIQFGFRRSAMHHLLFADDCLFSCKAEEQQSAALLRILEMYGQVTGQVINPSKSSIIFGKQVSEENKSRVKQLLGPNMAPRLGKRLSGWHAKTLSQGGKEVLIKAVGTALPVSAMSVFKLPKTTLSSLTSALASFWWSSVEHKRKIHWLSWEKMCLPKKFGGLGFKDLESFSQALLAKQAWRLLYSEDCLMSHDGCTQRQLEMVSVLTYGRSHGLKMMKESCAHFDANLRVSDLIDTHTGRWCLTRLKEIFVPGDIKILQSNQPVILKPDSWVWKHTQSSVYSVKTSYELAFAENNQELLREHYVYPSINPLKNQVWHIKAPSKLKVFLWKALSGALPVLDGLQARGLGYIWFSSETRGFQSLLDFHQPELCDANMGREKGMARSNKKLSVDPLVFVEK
ncbi:uncharacterized protein LOC108824620 [Raphanus sativus]|uniref:Uncharacterized protein LOC108824620 n=1 Tax=Raphanus sativus TaxID=3726 RepID=A0A9W3CGE4_RAPSA|nr:uncharacterized protein LOC108824620 [Raphanus sativus]